MDVRPLSINESLDIDQQMNQVQWARNVTPPEYMRVIEELWLMAKTPAILGPGTQRSDPIVLDNGSKAPEDASLNNAVAIDLTSDEEPRPVRRRNGRALFISAPDGSDQHVGGPPRTSDRASDRFYLMGGSRFMREQNRKARWQAMVDEKEEQKKAEAKRVARERNRQRRAARREAVRRRNGIPVPSNDNVAVASQDTTMGGTEEEQAVVEAASPVDANPVETNDDAPAAGEDTTMGGMEEERERPDYDGMLVLVPEDVAMAEFNERLREEKRKRELEEQIPGTEAWQAKEAERKLDEVRAIVREREAREEEEKARQRRARQPKKKKEATNAEEDDDALQAAMEAALAEEDDNDDDGLQAAMEAALAEADQEDEDMEDGSDDEESDDEDEEDSDNDGLVLALQEALAADADQGQEPGQATYAAADDSESVWSVEE